MGAKVTSGHQPCLIALIILNFLFFVVSVLLSYLAGNPKASDGLFIHGIANVSAKYYIEITPASVTFSIWGLIYAWQGVWIIYSLVSICRNTPYGPAYTNPVLLPPSFFIASILNWVSLIVWVFLWDREFIGLALPFLFTGSFALYICLGISYRRLKQNEMILIDQGRKYDIWLVRFMVQNGQGLYGAWTTIATLLNLGSVIAYRTNPSVDQSTASTIALGILSTEIVIFVSTDLSVFNKFSRYTIVPYLVVIIALVGSIAKNWDPLKTNSVFSAVLLGVAAVCLVLKIAVLFGRSDLSGKYETLRPYREISDVDMAV